MAQSGSFVCVVYCPKGKAKRDRGSKPEEQSARVYKEHSISPKDGTLSQQGGRGVRPEG